MLQSGNTIRLTSAEKEHFRAMTGRPEIPETVLEYNRALDVAEKNWLDVGTPEGELLAAMTGDMRLPAVD